MENNTKKIYKGLKALAAILIILAGIKFTFGNINNYPNTMSFTGSAEVKAVPDIATIYFTIRQEAPTVKEAQEKVAEIEKSVLAFLAENEIDEKDIKTEISSFNPKYEYKYGASACYNGFCPPSGKSVIIGYEAYESINLKIRNTDNVGKIMEGLGSLKVSELNGPNFTVDNEDELKEQARREAIVDAKKEAKILSKDLGIRLGKIISFSDSEDAMNPMYFKSDMAMEATSSIRPVLEVPKGENIISSQVIITYKIR
jgi:uncharacterized protein YggE